MNITKTIAHLHEHSIFSDFDIHFAQLMTELAHRRHDELLFFTTALLSYFTAQGHVCLDLTLQAEQIFPVFHETDMEGLQCPPLTSWLEAIHHWSIVGSPQSYTPLILDQQRLYFYRYWDYEQQLARQIHTRLCVPHPYGLSTDYSDADEQSYLAHRAASSHFCIVSGEPGTGKTVSILKILIALFKQNAQYRVALVTPTGQAAAHLKQTLMTHAHLCDCPPEIRILLPKEVFTLHRLLAIQTHLSHKRSFSSSLPYDVLIIDEASMVDLSLMTQLTQALPSHARLILVGDPAQLNAIGVGTVLGDLCYTPSSLLQKQVLSLKKNYRFRSESGIYQLAQSIKQGNSEVALSLLKSKQYPDISWSFLRSFETLSFLLTESIIEKFSCYFTEQTPKNLLQSIEKFCILCTNQRGQYGVETLNRLIEQKLMDKGWMNTNTRWYPGRPIVITRNAYTFNLFNGDLGLISRTHSTELQAIFFSKTSHPYEQQEIRTFLPHQLPEHETVYAMTIHKSQGSEFEEVLIVLPEHFSPLLTRELLYTAVTRAKQKVSIWGNEQVFKQIVSQKVSRTSGLQEALLRF